MSRKPSFLEIAAGAGKASSRKEIALAANRAAADLLVAEIQELETRAHRLGFHVTGHALNRAKNALGWEIAGDVVQAGKAALPA